MSATIGIDISKRTFDAYVEHSEYPRHQQFPNNAAGFQAFRDWAGDPADIRQIGMEATERYGLKLARYLHATGYAISRINPRRVKAFGDSLLQRNKTDKHDARVIAKFIQAVEIPLWKPKNPAMSRLRQRTRHVRAILEAIQQQRNRLQSGLTDPSVRQFIQDHIAFLKQQLKELRESIQSLIQHHEVLQRRYDLLISIPGIAARTAPILIAEIGDINRFDNSRQLAAYAGLTPAHYQSGTSVRRRSRISKSGNSHLRTALYMPAIVAKRCNPHAKRIVNRLMAKDKKPKVIIVAIMHKLLRIAYGILKHEQPYDADYLAKTASNA